GVDPVVIAGDVERLGWTADRPGWDGGDLRDAELPPRRGDGCRPQDGEQYSHKLPAHGRISFRPGRKADDGFAEPRSHREKRRNARRGINPGARQPISRW